MLIGTFVDESSPTIEYGPGSKISAFPPGWIHSKKEKDKNGNI